MKAEQSKLRKVLRLPFLVYAIGHIVSVFGDISLFLALNWLIYERTHSATAVAIAALFEALPVLLLGPVVGAVVDRVDRRVLLVACDLVRVTVVVVISLFADQLGIYALYALILSENIASTIFMPARSAMLPSLVESDAIPVANAVLGFTRQWVQIGAWVSAGVMLPLLGFRGVAWLDAGTFAVSLLTLVILFRVGKGARLHGKDRPYRNAVKEGWQYAWGTRWIRNLLLLFAAASFASAPMFTLTPVYTEQILGGNSSVYGIVQAGLMVGLLLGNIVGGALERMGLGRMLLVGIMSMGAAFFLTILDQPVWLGVAMYGLVGCAMSMVNIATFSLLQTRVPADQQGRTFSLLTAVAAGATPATLVMAGPLSDMWGLRAIYLGGGVLVVLVGVLALVEGSIIRLNKPEPASSLAANQ